MTEPYEEGAEPIAIVGCACRVPGAADVARFWDNLVNGRVARTELDRARLLAAGVPVEDVDDPDYVPVAYLLDDLDRFDADLFGLTPREAALADPQHRLFLELCHTALEDGGHDPATFTGDIAVYGGRGMEAYRWTHVLRNRAVAAVTDHTTLGMGNHADTFTTAVSYRLNLRGPSVGVYTACSTSLVAVHLAAEALRARECDLALAGGANIELPAERGYRHRDGGVESADGWCRPFDGAASGTVWGSGGGAVLLKRLDDAVAAGDHVRAVIRGNAINNDGGAKMSFAAPSVTGQAAAVANALGMAGVAPDTIGYVEAFGLGVALADQIEATALASVFGPGATRSQWCALGSVKANVGHLSQAAGVVSLIKAVLALEHGILPPTPTYATPNPTVEPADGPFYVNATLASWPREGHPRRAGVSAFGIGGTNAHVVLEEAPPAPATVPVRPAELLCLSARSEPALAAAVERLAGHLAQESTVDLHDAAHTLRVGRAAHPYRAAVVAGDRAAAVAALRGWRPRGVAPVAGPPPVVFLFPGEGAGRPGPARSLYGHEPVFAAALDECADLVRADLDLHDVLAATDDRVERPSLGHPATFAVDYALARLWASWGVRPTAMLGHSLGEYVAATLAGVFTLPAALHLVAVRGRLLESVAAGAMVTVTRPAAEVGPTLPAGLAIAAVNTPGTCVVSGPSAAVEEWVGTVDARTVRRLRSAWAYHSPLVEPALAELAEAVVAAGPVVTAVPHLSGRTGGPVAEEVGDPGYWTAELREPVRFADALAAVRAEGLVLVECGPGRQLGGFAVAQLDRDAQRPIPGLPADGRPTGGPTDDSGADGADLTAVYEAAGVLWTRGVTLAPGAVGGPGRRIPLPGYPYQRKRHWIDPDPVEPASTVDTAPPAAPAPVADGDVGERVARIWAEQFGLDQVGPDDDFFALGGTSLLAVTLVSEVGKAFGVRLPVRSVFDTPTPDGMAGRVRSLRVTTT